MKNIFSKSTVLHTTGFILPQSPKLLQLHLWLSAKKLFKLQSLNKYIRITFDRPLLAIYLMLTEGPEEEGQEYRLLTISVECSLLCETE